VTHDGARVLSHSLVGVRGDGERHGNHLADAGGSELGVAAIRESGTRASRAYALRRRRGWRKPRRAREERFRDGGRMRGRRHLRGAEREGDERGGEVERREQSRSSRARAKPRCKKRERVSTVGRVETERGSFARVPRVERGRGRSDVAFVRAEESDVESIVVVVAAAAIGNRLPLARRFFSKTRKRLLERRRLQRHVANAETIGVRFEVREERADASRVVRERHDDRSGRG